MPKSNAPKLIKLALTRFVTMPVMVNNMAKGITNAVINAARKCPKNTNNTAITNNAPSSRFFLTVLMVASTKWVRSYTGLATTPSGKLC